MGLFDETTRDALWRRERKKSPTSVAALLEFRVEVYDDLYFHDGGKLCLSVCGYV